MAMKTSHRIEAINFQVMGVDKGTMPLQFIPSSKSSKPKSHWIAAKKILRLPKSDNFVAVKVPDYCPSHTPLHTSFASEESLAHLLSEIPQRDSELQQCLEERRRECARISMTGGISESFDREEEERDKFEEEIEPNPKQVPEDLKHFQDYVNQFLSLFLQSEFLRSVHGISSKLDPEEIIRSLANSKNCPDVILFRRVAVDPNLIAGAVPDINNLTYAENGVALNQLARFLDVAVLQFLSAVNEYTDTHAVLWALEYLSNLLQSLISSMNNLNSFGWYGAPHIRIRKGTAMGRPSISYPLQPPFILNPPPVVVVAGTPPQSPESSPERNIFTSGSVEETRDPVTGQRSPVLSPLMVQHVAVELSGQDSTTTSTSVQLRTGMEPRSRGEIATAAIGVGSRPPPSKDAAGGGNDMSGRTRRNSRQEPRGITKPSSFDLPTPGAIGGKGTIRSASFSPSSTQEGSHLYPHQQTLHGILKTPSVESAISPPRSPSRSPSRITPANSTNPVNLSRSQTTGASVGRKRKLTPAGPPPGFVPRNTGLSHPHPHGLTSHQGTDDMNSIQEEDRDEMDDVEMDYFESFREKFYPSVNENRRDVAGDTGNLTAGLVHSGLEGDVLSPMERETFSPIRSPLDRERFSPPCASSPPNLDSILEESVRIDDGEDSIPLHISPSNINHTPNRSPRVSPSRISSHVSPSASPLPNTFRDGGSLRSSMSPPPAPKDLPRVDIRHELSTFTNGEGRISLLAILHAVTKLPECKAVWSDEVGEKCFSLIQYCIDIGLPPKEEVSSTKPKATTTLQERRKKLTKQENTTDKAVVPEKPWIEHGKHIVEFSMKALIQCSTCSLVGCSADNCFCRLQISTFQEKSSLHNKLIRNLKRINLHSPSSFRQAVINFARPSMSSCRKLFRFLHVVLQYCSHAIQEVHFNPLVDTVVAGVLSVVVDRLASLDLSETSIQEVSGWLLFLTCFCCDLGAIFIVRDKVRHIKN